MLPVTKKIKWLLLGLLVTSCCTTSVQAQTINAASCSEADVQKALNLATPGSTVAIPAGTCTWSSALNYSAPANFTLKGQTVCAGSGAPGGSLITCTDNTVIVDGQGGNNGDPGILSITTNATGSFRLTGITLSFGKGPITYNGSFRFGGATKQLRIDHNHFNLINIKAFLISNNLTGVIDHNLGDGVSGSGWAFQGGTPTVTTGDVEYSQPTSFGGSNFAFFENNTFNDFGNDCIQGGRWVIRFNTSKDHNGTEPYQTHGTGSDGRARGCRAWELYKNSASHPTCGDVITFPPCGDVFMSTISGTALIWGNTATSDFKNFVNIHSERRNNAEYPQTATPNGWGYCGTSFNGTGSNWDQNGNTTTGYRCMDQPGQGQGDLLSGSFPNVTNTATGCNSSLACAWPRQKLEPLYEWMDSWTNPNKGGSFWSVYETDALFPNSDFYLWCDPSSPSGCTSFNGTVGVGSGTLAARPATCTTGVGYWATDQGNWNQSGSGGQGELFVCGPTNTWTLYYTPYTYPHPLTSGSGTPPPAPPSNLAAAVQ